MILGRHVISHFGTKGMKWGTHKGSSDGNRGASIRAMSDTELRTRIGRMQLERTYSQMTKPEKSMGKKLVDEIIVAAAKQTAKKYVAAAMTQGVARALNVQPVKKDKE